MFSTAPACINVSLDIYIYIYVCVCVCVTTQYDSCCCYLNKDSTHKHCYRFQKSLHSQTAAFRSQTSTLTFALSPRSTHFLLLLANGQLETPPYFCNSNFLSEVKSYINISKFKTGAFVVFCHLTKCFSFRFS